MESLKSRIEKINSLKIGRGLQELLNEGHKVLGNPILIHGMEYETISFTENIVTDDPIWNEYVETGTVGLHWLEFFKEESFMYEAANTKKVVFLRSDKLKYERIYAKVFSSEGIQIGCAVLVECQSPFDEHAAELMLAYCDKLNEEFALSEHYRNYGQAYQEILVNKLIDGTIKDRAIYAAHVESIYINLKAILYLAVVDISRCNDDFGETTYLRDLLKRAEPRFKYSIYNNRIMIIISSEKEVSNINEALSKLSKIFKENCISIGMSEAFENLFELSVYYDQAIKALGYGMKGGCGQRICWYKEVKQYL